MDSANDPWKLHILADNSLKDKKPRSLRSWPCNSLPAPPSLPPQTGSSASSFRFNSPVPSMPEIEMPMSFSGDGSSSSLARFWQPRSWLEVHIRLRGSPPQELGKKQIMNSETDTNQSRLLIPMELRERILDYATELERQSIHSPGGLEVMVLDSLGLRYDMMCKFRSSQKGMVFNGRGWNEFAKNNNLQLGHKLCVMAFRADYKGNLCFAFL